MCRAHKIKKTLEENKMKSNRVRKVSGYAKLDGITVSTGNRKLKNVIIFNLPAGKEFTCKESCAGCYAQKAQRQYPEVLPCRIKNLEASKKDDFVANMVEILSSLRQPYVRFHESGDIYSQEYFDKLVAIAKAVNKKFYIYTKRDNEFDLSDKPDNLNIIFSILPCGNYNYGSNDFLFEMKETYPFAHICECGFGGKFESKCGKDCTLCMEGQVNFVLFKAH
jgi:hypothetical protein